MKRVNKILDLCWIAKPIRLHTFWVWGTLYRLIRNTIIGKNCNCCGFFKLKKTENQIANIPLPHQ